MSAAPFLPVRTERLTLRAHREADLADVIARDSGASVKALDPIAGLSEAFAGDDYFEVMRSNLTTLREDQDCN